MFKKLIEEINEVACILENTSQDERNIRELLSQEYEAVKTYEQFMVEAENEDVRKVLNSISREEMVHIGELEALLSRIGMSSTDVYREGEREVTGMLNMRYTNAQDLEKFR